MIIRLLVYLLIFNMVINWLMYGHFSFAGISRLMRELLAHAGA